MHVTQLQDQRHPGKEGARISRNTIIFDPYPLEKASSPCDEGRGASQETLTAGADQASDADVEGHLHGLELALVIVGVCLAVFLVSIDRTIITTAIPYITHEFKSTRDIGWYGSAYMIAACAFQPIFGRVYLFFNIKWSYLFSLIFFEAGSLICALAPVSSVLIVGRAIAGFGSAGLLTGSFVIVASAIPLQQRPVYTAIVGMMFGVGATAGPLLGGVLTDLVTWRWCFYLNLPVGAVTLLALLLCFKPKVKHEQQQSLLKRLSKLDWLGNLLIIGASVMLVLALQLASTSRSSWQDPTVIGLLCGFGVSTIAFAAWTWRMGDNALLPPSIILQRSVAASCAVAFFLYAALLTQTYFLPIWFQAILGTSALESGVYMIPYFVINALFSLLAGVLVSVSGYYVPPCLAGNAIATVGSGLLTMLSPKTSTAEWIGFEILVAVGFGLSVQQGFTAVQTVLPTEQISIATAAVVACQSLGGAIFVSVGDNVFQSRLIAEFQENPVAGVDIYQVIRQGATAFRDIVSPDALPKLLAIYNDAIQTVFLVTVPLVGAAFLSSLFLEWKSVRSKRAA